MIKYNFVNNYSGLTVWKKSDLKKGSDPSETGNEKLIKNLEGIYKIILKNKISYVPTITTLFGYLIINLYALPARINIKKLEGRNYEFQEKIQDLSSVQENIKGQIKEMEKYYGMFTQGAPSFLFAYYIQKSIPANIQLTEYIIDKDGFRLFASSYSMDSLNIMIQEMLSWPILESNSILVNNVITQVSQGNQANSLNSMDVSIVEITGKVKGLGLIERLQLYKDSFNYGHANKLYKYINLNSLTLKEGL